MDRSLPLTTLAEAAFRDCDAHKVDWRERTTNLHAFIKRHDPRNATALYEEIADAFRRETGLWPPGRSAPAAMCFSEAEHDRAREVWRLFVDRWIEADYDRVLAGSVTCPRWMRERTHGCYCSAWRWTKLGWRIWKDGNWRVPVRGDVCHQRRAHVNRY